MDNDAMTRSAETPFLLEVALEPMSAADQEKMRGELERFAADGVPFRWSTDQELGQSTIAAIDEPHLTDLLDRLKREHNVMAMMGNPQVVYRETLGAPATVECTHERHDGGCGQYARVKIQFDPLPSGDGQRFEAAIADGVIPNDYILAVEKGLNQIAESGIIIGFPVVDYKATLVDGACHDTDSSALAFEIAARAAFREAAKRCQPKLLEPIMNVEVVTPDDYVAAVIADLTSRRGRGLGREKRDGATVVKATAPLAALIGYADALRAMTDGKARFSLQLDGFEAVPQGGGDDDLFPPAIGMRA